jgi:hypothetical protein
MGLLKKQPESSARRGSVSYFLAIVTLPGASILLAATFSTGCWIKQSTATFGSDWSLLLIGRLGAADSQAK